MKALLQRFSSGQWQLAGILAVVALLLGLMLNPYLTVVNHDSAIFCILAQSLLKGHYLLVSEPNPQPYFTFPPFLAVQLAALMLLFQNFDPQAMQLVFKGYISLLFLLSLPLFFGWVKSLLSTRTALILTLLVGLNPIVFKYTSDILSDTPFWALSMGAIYAVWRFQESTNQHQSSPGAESSALRWFSAALVLVILCALTRQIGMALVLAFLMTLAQRRQWKCLVAALVAILVTVGGWQSYEHFYRSAHRSDISSLNQQGVQEVLDRSPIKLEYVKHFLIDKPVHLDENRSQANPMILAENLVQRVDAYTQVTLDQLIPALKVRLGGSTSPKINLAHLLPLKVIVWILFGVGLVLLYRAFPFAALYLALSMAVLLVYPYISQRFLLPLYPLILLCLSWGLRQGLAVLSQKRPAFRQWQPVLVIVLTVLALIASLIETLHWVNAGYRLKVANQGPSLRTGNRAYYRTLLWLKVHTPPDSLIISRKSPVTYFYSGRKSTAYPFTADQAQLFAYIQEKKARYGRQFPHVYVFEDTAFVESQRLLTPALEKYQDRLQLVYTEPTTQSRVWLLK
jgi:4-amino-4-deoxy-L-arabinose transferase-like glycosyltransferase